MVRKMLPSARHGGRLGLRWVGWGGVPGFGPSDPRTPAQGPHRRTPTPDGHPGGGAGGLGAGLGGTRCLQLSVFGAAQRKMLSRWDVPDWATGAPLPEPPPRRMGGCTQPSLFSFRAPSRDAPPRLCPTSRGDQSANRGPLWAGRHQGGGVAPGCKALAEEVWGACWPFQTPPQAPAWQGTWGLPSSAPWATGVGSHLSSFVGGIAMRGQQLEVAGEGVEGRGGGGGCPWPLHIPAGPRGAGSGDQALEPLAHLPPPGAKWGIPPPRARVDGDPDGCPPLGSSGSPRYPPKPLPRKVHFLQCVQRGPLPGAVEPAAGVQWGWPPLPQGGAGGQLHRLLLPNRAGTGLRASPRQAAGHTGFGAGAGPTTQDTLEKVCVAPRP